MQRYEDSLRLSRLREHYRNGSITPRQLIRSLLDNITDQQDYHCWIEVLDETQLAGYLDHLENTDPETLPLYGVPFAIKDNIDLADVPTTAACPAFSYTPVDSAPVVQRLIDAGAIPLGKTNLDQFATGLVGTRSPYGFVMNPFNREFIAGGSSSGSAVAVALGQVSFALGTDTAGSGRIPAAFNNLVGLKPSRGRLSIRGVVPACRSLDCVSLFTLDLEDAGTLFDILDVEDPGDIYARAGADRLPRVANVIGVPQDEQLEFFGNAAYRELFDNVLNGLQDKGYRLQRVDFRPFIETARLLYEGPWIAERYHAIAGFIEQQPEALHPVTREIITPARSIDAVRAFDGLYTLQSLKRAADAVIDTVDFMLTPTAPTHYTLAAIEQEPIELNARLGYYTNFMNLLDYAALAIPAGFDRKGLPFGVTLFAPAMTDQHLLLQAARLLSGTSLRLGATPHTCTITAAPAADNPRYLDVAVCGAHLSGMPLNHQLTDRGGSLLRSTRTATEYRFYALAGGPPWRPGLVRDTEAGSSIEVEVWRLPVSEFGSFIREIPHPLGIGTITLEDGSTVNGFICEPCGLAGAEDITRLGGWRRFIREKTGLA